MARYVEQAYRVDRIAEEVDTVRAALRVGEDIEYSAAQLILPWFVNEVHLRKATIDELLLEIGHDGRIAD